MSELSITAEISPIVVTGYKIWFNVCFKNITIFFKWNSMQCSRLYVHLSVILTPKTKGLRS